MAEKIQINRRDKWYSLFILILAQVFALSLWFSSTATIPQIKAAFDLPDLLSSLYSSAVAIGFVAGTLTSAMFGLSDRINPKKLFAWAAFLAGLMNGALLVIPPDSFSVVPVRFITGFCMAGIYPVGMRIAASWSKGDTGLLVGLLVGALTLGSASPHLFNALGGVEWPLTIFATSLAAFLAAGLIFFTKLGAGYRNAPAFHWRDAIRAWTSKPLRLANLGYLGHMWELYAMWAWVGPFFVASFSETWSGLARDVITYRANLATFATIGVGAFGCFLGGIFADRLGRTTLTILAMAISGSSALLIGFFFGGNPALVILIALVWGVFIVADSPQFSSAMVELSRPELTGTMLTVQTSTGFLLTLLTIHLVPVWVDAVGWGFAFAPLAIGPFLGIIAMARLRGLPEAGKLAGGKK